MKRQVARKTGSHRPHAVAWHQLQMEEVLELLKTDLQMGLSSALAKQRQAEYGLNEVTVKKGMPAWKRLLGQFYQPLILILLAAVGITAALGHYVDASVIFGVVLANAMVGYLQESKAEKAISALKKVVRSEVTVRRDGRKQRIPSVQLVPGDVVVLQAGDKVPADLRLFHVRNLQVDESLLTGESVPVFKHPAVLTIDTLLADRKNLAFSGTLVTSGMGEGVVWATGDKTETGRIAWLISEAVELSTPLTRKIAHFSRVLLYLILGLAALTFLVGILHGEKAIEMFMAAVALAVGAIPEGLPAAVTITLAIGVGRMARRRAIIRRLPAVEALGSTTVICSDKTGTLTQNQMTVQEVFAGGKWYEILGTGYEPKGDILHQGRPIPLAEHPALRECLLAGLLCNDAVLIHKEGQTRIEGDPTEGALLVAARKAGLGHEEWNGRLPRLDAIPFESEHQFMATLHQASEQRLIYKKGAVERLLDRCATALDAEGNVATLDKASIRRAVDDMASKGLRVLAFARRHLPADQHRLHQDHVSADLTFLGLQGMIDPPRPEAVAAVRRCQSAGITVKMITGDHALTAGAIARQIGLGRPREKDGDVALMSGRELERVDPEDLPNIAEATSVFARVLPEQKLHLVKALQARGHVVAMTGDGVNDAPALKQADIGVAMGQTGTDVAKGAADMILTDDNFASIEAAVEEGRGVFDNLTKFIIWTLPTNGGEGLTLLTAILLGTTLPALPVQLLWINMTTAVLLGLMLVFEPKEKGLMERPPRDPAQPILTFPLLLRTGLVTLLMTCGAFALFLWEQQAHGASLAQARTIVVNVIVVVESFYLLNCRSITRSMFAIGFLSNPWVFTGIGVMLGAQILFSYAPLMNRLFHSAPISLEAWAHIALVGLLIYSAVGLEKWFRRGKAHSTVERKPGN